MTRQGLKNVAQCDIAEVLLMITDQSKRENLLGYGVFTSVKFENFASACAKKIFICAFCLCARLREFLNRERKRENTELANVHVHFLSVNATFHTQ